MKAREKYSKPPINTLKQLRDEAREAEVALDSAEAALKREEIKLKKKFPHYFEDEEEYARFRSGQMKKYGKLSKQYAASMVIASDTKRTPAETAKASADATALSEAIGRIFVSLEEKLNELRKKYPATQIEDYIKAKKRYGEADSNYRAASKLIENHQKKSSAE